MMVACKELVMRGYPGHIQLVIAKNLVCQTILSLGFTFCIRQIRATRTQNALSRAHRGTLMCRWVLVPWEFVKFNLLQDGSAMYGSHPWHWNFTQGFPTITVTFLPLAVWGMNISQKRYGSACHKQPFCLLYCMPASSAWYTQGQSCPATGAYLGIMTVFSCHAL